MSCAAIGVGGMSVTRHSGVPYLLYRAKNEGLFCSTRQNSSMVLVDILI